MKKISLYFLAVLSYLVLFTNPVLAKFSEKERSINATAETLPENSGEIGFASFSFGVTDNTMITVPTLPLFIGGSVSVNVRHKFSLTDKVILSPNAGAGYYFSNGGGFLYNAGLALGINFDSKHALTFGGNLTNAPRLEKDAAGEYYVASSDTPYGAPFVNYDFYRDNGDLVWVGLYSLVPVAGYTWAWENFHFGAGLATILPFVYLYWRF